MRQMRWHDGDHQYHRPQGLTEKILRHCGLWKESMPRPPPQVFVAIEETPFGEILTPDYGFVADQEYEETTTQASIPDYDLVFSQEPNTDDCFF